MTFVVKHSVITNAPADTTALIDGPAWDSSHSLSGQMALANGGTGSDLSVTGGSGQFVKQTSIGAGFSVGALVSSDLPTSITMTSTGNHYAPSANIQRFSDRVFVGDATANNGTQVASQPDWLTTFQIATGRSGGFIQEATCAALNGTDPQSTNTLVSGAQTSHIILDGLNAIGSITVGVNNNTAHTLAAFASYSEAYRMSGALGGATGYEIDTVNYASAVAIDPFQQVGTQTIGLQIAAGAGLSSSGQFSSSAAINIQNNNAAFLRGINFGNGSLDTGANANPDALAMPDAYSISWYNATGSKTWQLYSTHSGANGNLTLTPGGTGALVINTSVFSSGSLNISGSSGAGYLQIANQSGTPSTPTTAIRLYADNSNRFGWVGTNGFAATLDATANTASRAYVMPDAAGTVVLNSNTVTLTGKTFDTAGSGNVFKINGTTISAVTGTGSAVLSASPTLTGTINAGAIALTANSNLTLSQNTQTAFTISNTNAGSSTQSAYVLTTNAGNFTVGAGSTAAGSAAQFLWNGSGDMLFDHQNAAGGMQFRTGSTPTTAISVDVNQNVSFAASALSSSASGGIGYKTGAGGAVTQATSRTTGVTLNNVSGAITLFAAAPTVGTWVSFTVTNSTVAATDVPHVAFKSGTNTYVCNVSAVAAGSFQISFMSIAGTSSDSPVINFAVTKAVAS